MLVHNEVSVPCQIIPFSGTLMRQLPAVPKINHTTRYLMSISKGTAGFTGSAEWCIKATKRNVKSVSVVLTALTQSQTESSVFSY